MLTLQKTGEDYLILSGETIIAKLEKNRFGTHGHSRGWNHYKAMPDSSMMWCGVDKRIFPNKPDAPELFKSIQEAREYYGIGGKA